jgi:hypothetical protein
MAGSEPSLTLDATRVGSAIQVAGKSDLPDGTILQYNVWQQDDDPIHAAFGETEIAGGRYQFSVPIDGWPDRDYIVRVAFSAGEFQPNGVVDRFGADGERLAGPHVSDDSGRVMVLKTNVPAS